MTSVQERLQLKREPLDKWSVREQLCLASAVCRSGDQNWMSVSRALKPFGEPNRPSDWFHQKNCAAQYGMLLGNVETPKRKNKKSTVDSGGETPAESILKRLITERQIELKKFLTEEKTEYQKLQEDMILLQSGKVTDDQLNKWCQEIEEEENQKEQESIVHSQWLKERELRKQEIEKVWRPPKSMIGHKRKNSDPLDNLIEHEHMDEIALQQQHHQIYPQTPEPMKPALSPLLTSLLKSPSQVQSTPILHTAITNRPIPNTSTNPMIASLLNASPTVTVSPSLQQLVSSAIGQETQEFVGQLQHHQQEHHHHHQQQHHQQQHHPIPNDILDDANMHNLKIDDLANSILVQDGPLPEIKKEEVDDIISEIIENAHDIVSDPEQHLQLDGNGDINLGLDDFDDDDDLQDIGQPKVEVKEEKENEEKFVPPAPVVDPFEFQEDPVIHLEPSVKVSNINKQEHKQYVPQYQQQTSFVEPVTTPVKDVDNVQPSNRIQYEHNEGEVKENETSCGETQQFQPIQESPRELPPDIIVKQEQTPLPGSVEIVEVVVTDDEETDKDLVKSEIVNSVKSDDSEDVKSVKTDIEDKIKTEIEESSPTESKDTASIATFEESSETSDSAVEIKKEVEQDTETKTEFPDELFDEINMEVKFDKSGKAKRDYSRTKKKEEKGFHMLLAIEKAQLEDPELTEETLSDNTADTEKKDIKPKIKVEIERSNSPWTEEEDGAKGSKRRYSTSVTPTDSIPNSPASSSTFYDDDRDYRNWKKSVMLVYNRLATNKYASLFLKPITDEQAPGYSATVYRPVDLLSIKKNIENGTIRSTLEFKRDTMLMFTNAIMYNRTNSLVYNMAFQMQQECIEPIDILMMAESHNDFSLRRETRTSELGTKRKRTLTDELLLKSTSKKRKED